MLLPLYMVVDDCGRLAQAQALGARGGLAALRAGHAALRLQPQRPPAATGHSCHDAGH